MATHCITQVTFKFDHKRKPVVAAFDREHASSDGGAILLKGLDTQFGLTKRLAACLADPRQPGKVQHQTLELLRQRVFGLACGYADCNDAARLAGDAIHKLLVGRDPLAGPALASQPTLSRFENAVGTRELIAMGHVLADTVIEHHRRRLKGRARRITIDLDPTDDPTHGQQEFTFFNGHYDTWCYLPMVATVTFDDEAEQYAVAAVLRPGNAPASLGARGLLRRLAAPRLRGRRDSVRRSEKSARRWTVGQVSVPRASSVWPLAQRRAYTASSLEVTRRNRLVGPRRHPYSPLRAPRDPGRARS